MTEPRWERAKSLVYQALQLRPEERADFLDGACEEPSLRAEVDSLLAVDDAAAQHFLDAAPFRETTPESSAIDSVSRLEAGQVFADRFRLVRKLGEGGMGQVWLAEQTAPVRRSVALKLIKAGMYDESVVQRFQSERQSLAIMDHPCIAKVFDAGATPQGQPYFVMEYVPGQPITEYCDAHKLDIRARLQLFIQACEGVQHAHQKAIIHRDLKPANILVIEVDGKPVPRIIDFGLAKATERSSAPADQTMLTRFGHFMGTPGYMSPEQVDPEIHDIDTRTDVYSLGVILYVMLTGLQPFETKGRKRPPLDVWLRQLREEEPPSPSTKVNTERETSSASAQARGTQPKQLVSVLRGDLDWIAMKALERDRERRYATPLDLASDLRRYLNDEPVTARPASAGYQLRKFVRRHRFATAFIGMVTVLSVVASAAAVIALKQKSEAEHQTAETLSAQARLLTQAAVQRFKELDVAGAQNVILQVLTNPAFSGRNPPSAVTLFQDARAADLQIAVLAGHSSRVHSAAYSPDGARIVTTSYDQTARIWDAYTGIELIRPIRLGGYGQIANFSPDGMRVVTASDDKTARIWDARTGAPLVALLGHSDIVNSAAFSPDGRHVVTGSSDASVRIWDSDTGEQLAVFESNGNAINSVAYSPDGARIVLALDDKTARIWDAKTGRELLVLRGHEAGVTSANFSPDGRWVVTASDDKTARIWDARAGRRLAVLAAHTDAVESAHFSVDGARIATASQDQTVRIWNALTGVQINVLSGHRGAVYDAAFSPDGSRIVTASFDNTARIWEVSRGPVRIINSSVGGHVYAARFSPDGTEIVTTSDDKIGTIWDAATGQKRALLKGHTGGLMSAVFSSDGARIVTTSDDQTARIWDSATGAVLVTLLGHQAPVEFGAFSPDGKRVATASDDKTTRIWDAHTGTQLTLIKGYDEVLWAAFSPDGARIVTTSPENTATVWDSYTGAKLLVLDGHSERVNSASYSSDGTRIVTASDDKTARIWNSRTGKLLKTLSGHRGSIYSALYAPDGAHIVTASSDKTARIWDARTGEQLGVLMGHGDRVFLAEYSSDGRYIVTASNDGTARIWDSSIPTDLGRQIVWALAAESDPLKDAIRNELGIPPDPNVRSFSTLGSDCDRSAAADYDPERVTRGVLPTDIAVDSPNAACSAEAAKSDHELRAHYELGRMRFAHGNVEGAKIEFEIAVSQGYRAACIDLGDLLISGGERFRDPQRAVSLYEHAWQSGVTVAAFRLGQLYESGLPGSDPSVSSIPFQNPTEAWHWYQKGADAGEPQSLARFAARAEANALGQTADIERKRLLIGAFSFYAAAAVRANDENWPEAASRYFRLRRASYAHLLAHAGMMREVADAYSAVLNRWRPRRPGGYGS